MANMPDPESFEKQESDLKIKMEVDAAKRKIQGVYNMKVYTLQCKLEFEEVFEEYPESKELLIDDYRTVRAMQMKLEKMYKTMKGKT